MNFSKLSILIAFLVVFTLSLCLAKKAETEEKVAAMTKDESSSEKKADSKEATVEDGVQGGATGSEAGSSDFDIEQLLKLIDALKNQNFDQIDESLKGNKLMQGIAETIKEDEAKSSAESADKSNKSADKSKKSADKAKKSDEDSDDKYFEL